MSYGVIGLVFSANIKAPAAKRLLDRLGITAGHGGRRQDGSLYYMIREQGNLFDVQTIELSPWLSVIIGKVEDLPGTLVVPGLLFGPKTTADSERRVLRRLGFKTVPHGGRRNDGWLQYVEGLTDAKKREEIKLSGYFGLIAGISKR